MSELKVISIFTGAGGIDIGFEAAGFSTTVAVEMDEDCSNTLRRNHDWPVLKSDIHTISSDEILSAGELKSGEADVLIGGPPCQPFSKSAYWATGDTKRLDDPRASTLEQYLRVLRDTKPEIFVLENVPGLAYSNKREALDLFYQIIHQINEETGTNYQPKQDILNAVDFGVPQDRKRIFIIGHREGREFQFPQPTHRSVDDNERLDLGLIKPLHTAWDAIGDLQDLQDKSDESLEVTGKWADLLPTIPEGKNYLYHTARGGGRPLFGYRRRYWSFLLKLSKKLPSWTITAQPGSATGPFHWKSRRLSTRELCRLQTFPDSYKISGSRTSAQRQLGNAVPSALAEKLGLELRAQLFGQEDVQLSQLSLLPPRRTPIPQPEVPAPVPEKYLELEDDHSPHPGTGQGYGARSRASS